MVESIFNMGEQDLGCIFAPTPGYGADQYLSFVRSTLRLNNALTQPRLNSAGESSLSFSPSGTFLVNLQPKPTGFLRLVQGQVVQLAYVAFVTGNADIRETDRCSVSGKRLECTNVLHYGTESTEVELVQLGR